MTSTEKHIAIVDYGLGNLFSIQQACNYVGLQALITSSKDEILAAQAVILPGVGAFGDAMNALEKLDLSVPLQDVAKSGKYLIGICLGMQLLMTESYEFGIHKGLGIIDGEVLPFENVVDSSGDKLKVPQIGWNRINGLERGGVEWTESPLKGLPDGEFMYFVHSFYTKPASVDVHLTMTQYGNVDFCSSLEQENIFACQFHPERSASQGLKIYQNIATKILCGNGDEENG